MNVMIHNKVSSRRLRREPLGVRALQCCTYLLRILRRLKLTATLKRCGNFSTGSTPKWSTRSCANCFLRIGTHNVLTCN